MGHSGRGNRGVDYRCWYWFYLRIRVGWIMGAKIVITQMAIIDIVIIIYMIDCWYIWVF